MFDRGPKIASYAPDGVWIVGCDWSFRCGREINALEGSETFHIHLDFSQSVKSNASQ